MFSRRPKLLFCCYCSSLQDKAYSSRVRRALNKLSHTNMPSTKVKLGREDSMVNFPKSFAKNWLNLIHIITPNKCDKFQYIVKFLSTSF
jgi:hypothetical protein